MKKRIKIAFELRPSDFSNLTEFKAALRDHIAMLYMYANSDNDKVDFKQLAAESYQIADEMINARGDEAVGVY